MWHEELKVHVNQTVHQFIKWLTLFLMQFHSCSLLESSAIYNDHII